MTDRAEPLEIAFRCPPELKGILPPPFPAVEGLPEWYKAMPRKAFSEALSFEDQTVKRCPPFIDAMTHGFLIPLPTDLHVEDGCFSWDWDIPGAPAGEHVRSPIDFHDNSQVIGTPFFQADRFLIKFNNFWTIALPPGYSLLVTHPINRADLPFLTLSGLVDADRYCDNFLNFPAAWRDEDFEGVLPKGTPVAQCIPVARHSWHMRAETLSDEELGRVVELRRQLGSERDIYRRRFRARKR